ncbi:sulfatase [Actinoplanes sp. NPDC049668]|uniref:sulfatase n=1 Tax=unclassified Actinoplanes TaxID=2626549 RepID=UPI0033BE6A69
MSGSVREALVARFRRAEKAEAAVEAEPKPQADTAVAEAEAAPTRGRIRRIAGHVLTVSAIVLVFAALIMPNVISRLERPGTYLRLPIEGFVAVGLIILLPGRWKRIAAGVLGAGLGLLTVLKMIDMGFNETLNRPFDLVLDWELLDDAQSFLKDTVGDAGAKGALVGVVLLVVAILALTSLAAMRITRVAAAHRRATAGTAITGTAVWLVMLLLGVQVFNIPVAARSSALYVYNRAGAVVSGLQDEKNFAREAANDAFADTPGDQLLTGLRGKDVFFTFVESYGRSAIEDPKLAPGTLEVLAEGTESLKKAGFAAKSGFLASSTYGGNSWLAHSTFLSGVWIDNQQRYRNLMASDRLTMTMAFKKAGFDTVSVMPGATKAFPEGSFYGYNRVYDSRNTGYVGPKFSWAPQPDQYTMSWFEKNVHGPAHAPMMVEMPLVSSHTPWAPIPQFIDWNDVGDGSIYKQIQKEGKRPKAIWKDPAKVQREYSRSIQYTLTTITTWLELYGDENTVMVFLGDHQASKIVTGEGASHDVPITIVAKDKTVLDKIADWGWTDGLKPAPAAPVWRMNEFRDRFLTAYGPSDDVSRALSPPQR